MSKETKRTFLRSRWVAENGVVVEENNKGDLTLVIQGGIEVNIPLVGRTAMAMWFYDKMTRR